MKKVSKNILIFQGVATCIWFLLIFPSILIWKNSVAWIVLMSVWANFAAHAAGFVAALVEYQNER